jgi:glycosidase
MSDYHEIATAPGDLPVREIVRRHETVHEQLRHENTIEPGFPSPEEAVRVTALSGAGAGIASARVLYTTDGTLPSDTSPGVAMTRTGTEWVEFGGYAARWEAVIPGQPAGTVVRYRIRGATAEGGTVYAQDGQGFWYRASVGDGVTVFAYRVRNGKTEPAWLRDAVIYQVFVDRFRRRGGFRNTEELQAKHGGQLLGIVDALPYLQELGVTCLWLSPIGPAPSYHRYDATDYFAVDPILGDLDALRALTNAAHERGMRVLLDFVPSHLSSDHPAFVAAQRDPNAETGDWFTFYEWPDRYRSFLDLVPSLVSINTNSPGARRFLIESARFWMDHGIDGFRLDHVIGHGMDFWVEFQTALEERNADVVTIGEATDTGDALRRYRGRINEILDFPLARALRLTFATGTWGVAELDSFLDLYDAYMDSGPGRVSFLDNHDMDRFLHVAGRDKNGLKMAALCMMTLSQTPVVYYGTEIGMTHDYPTSDRRHGGDALVRQDMIWDEERWDHDLLGFFKELIALRRRFAEAVHGERRRIYLDSGSGCYAYAVRGGGKRLAVCFNLSQRENEVPLEAVEARFDGGANVLLATRPTVTGREAGIVLAGRSGAVVAL